MSTSTSRIETDTMGEIAVPESAYYGAQSARSLQNFAIGTETFTREFIASFGILKKACAEANHACGVLSNDKKEQEIEDIGACLIPSVPFFVILNFVDQWRQYKSLY